MNGHLCDAARAASPCRLVPPDTGTISVLTASTRLALPSPASLTTTSHVAPGHVRSLPTYLTMPMLTTQEQPMDDDLPRFLTVKEAGEVLRISESAIYDAAQAGTLKAIRVGRLLRIPRTEILRMELTPDTAPIMTRSEVAAVFADILHEHNPKWQCHDPAHTTESIAFALAAEVAPEGPS